MKTQSELMPNEEIREKNFAAFEKRYGVRPRIDPEENKKYRMEMTRSGDCAVYIKDAAPYGDLRLNSLYDPQYEAERWAEKQKSEDRRVTILMCGFSTGWYLYALMKKYRPDTKFFVFEPEEGLFSYVCAFKDLTYFIERENIELLITKHQRETFVRIAIPDITSSMPETRKIITPFYAEDALFAEACNSLAMLMVIKKNYATLRGRDTLSNRMSAWNVMRRSYFISQLKDKFPKDMPAVIVAAGPSLKKNVEVLKRIKGKALIIAVDRAVGVLDEYGIVPDMVTAMDTLVEASFADREIVKNVPLVCSYQVNPEMAKLFEGRSVYFHAGIGEEKLFGNNIELPPMEGELGGNVAGASLCVCLKLGIRTVILIGQDLASVGGRHHADDSDIGKEQEGMIEVEGVNGDTVYTSAIWMSYKDFYEREVLIHDDLRLIDATEGGALIHGTEIMTLSEVADKICTKNYDIGDYLKGLPYAQSEEDYRKMLNEIHKWMDDLDEISNKSKEIVTMCEQLLKIAKYNNIKDPKHAKKIEKMNKLRAWIYVTPVDFLLETYWNEDIYKIPDRTFVIRNNEDAIPVFENLIEYFTDMPAECESLKEKIKEKFG